MEFGYLNRWSKVPLINFKDVSAPNGVSNAQYLTWDATLSKWEPNFSGGAGGGDVTGPSSNVNGAIALFDGTTGKVLKDDSNFTYDPSSDTMFVQNITGNASTDLAIDGVSGGDINIAGYSAASGPGGVYLSSGVGPTLNRNKCSVLLETSDTVNGSIKLTAGDRTSTPFNQVNEVYVRGSSNTDAGYITIKSASADAFNAADILVRGGNGVNDNGGTIFFRQNGSTGNIGSSINITASESGGGAGGGVNIIGGNSSTAEGGDVNITGGSVGNIAGLTSVGGSVTLTSADNGSNTGCSMVLEGGPTGNFIITNGDVASNPSTSVTKISGASDGIEIKGGTYTSGNGPDVEIIAGESLSGASSGGNVYVGYGLPTNYSLGIHVNANDGVLTPGGEVVFTSGDAGSTGDGGAITFNIPATFRKSILSEFTAGDSTSGQSGSITFQAGNGTTTGGSVTFTGGYTLLGLDYASSSFSLFDRLRPAPSNFQVVGIRETSTDSPNPTHEAIECISPDADMIFKRGTLICRWDNSISLATAGLTAAGSAAVLGTLGSSTQVFLQLTPDSTGQNGIVYINAAGVPGYNTAYRNNWEFRANYYTNAIAGTNKADGTFIWGQGTAVPTPGYSESGTTGCSVFMDEYDGGSLLHRLRAYSGASAVTISQPYTGSTWGTSNNSLATIRVRKQGTTMLFEYTIQGDGSFASMFFSKEFTITNTAGDYYGVGARTGGATAFHVLRYFEFRQLPDDTPIVYKKGGYM